MTATQLWAIAYNLVCVVAALASELLSDGTIASALPPKWAHVISAVSLVAMWIKSHWNLFINPDGTSAKTAYVAPEKP